MVSLKSPIALFVPSVRKRWRKMIPWGVVIHTSGRGIVKRAMRKGKEPIEVALDWYSRKGSVHYVIDYDGEIYQLLDDDRRGAHVGISLLQRRSYLNGSWRRKVPVRPRLRWLKRWPGYKSPQHLYPTRSPNACYVGVEMLPLPKARHCGLWFTDAQHRAVGLLVADLRGRHRWPIRPVGNDPRVVGHEDLSAFTRWDNRGGWDPGGMRENPRFSWKRAL